MAENSFIAGMPIMLIIILQLHIFISVHFSRGIWCCARVSNFTYPYQFLSYVSIKRKNSETMHFTENLNLDELKFRMSRVRSFVSLNSTEDLSTRVGRVIVL